MFRFLQPNHGTDFRFLGSVFFREETSTFNYPTSTSSTLRLLPYTPRVHPSTSRLPSPGPKPVPLRMLHAALVTTYVIYLTSTSIYLTSTLPRPQARAATHAARGACVCVRHLPHVDRHRIGAAAAPTHQGRLVRARHRQTAGQGKGRRVVECVGSEARRGFAKLVSYLEYYFCSSIVGIFRFLTLVIV